MGSIPKLCAKERPWPLGFKRQPVATTMQCERGEQSKMETKREAGSGM